MFKPIENEKLGADFDLYELNRQLDITKSKVFMGKNAAFLGPLMSMMNFVWSEEVPTAATNGHQFWWNPHWFLSLDPEVRKTVMVHELWHPARLHMVRCGDRDPQVWNYACVAEGTLISMADGTQKAIENITSGDEIQNLESGTSVVAHRLNSGMKDILEIEFESGRILRCTNDHRILTENGFQTAAQLSAGSTCFVDTRHDKIP